MIYKTNINKFSKFLLIPLSWILAIHVFEIIIFPSLNAQSVILSNINLTQRFLDIWFSNSDSHYYFQIAKEGYLNTSAVFFPAWPMIAKITGPTQIGMKILSIGFTLGFFALLPNLLKALRFQKKYLETLIVVLLAYPTAFILNSPMTEPFFLFITALTVLKVEKGNYKSAALLIAVASATRPNGFLLVTYLIIKLLSKGKGTFLKNIHLILLSLSGLILFAAYLHFFKGDLFAFYHEQRKWNNSFGIDSLKQLLVWLREISFGIFSSDKPNPLKIYQLSSIFFFFGLTIFSYKKINFALWSYSFLTVLMPILSNTYAGTPRYLLAAFPFFIPFAVFLHKKRYLFYFYIFISVLFQSYLLIRFLNFEAT